jgi:hypothetical protein
MSNAKRPMTNGSGTNGSGGHNGASDNVIKLKDRKPAPAGGGGSRPVRALWTFLFATLVGPAIAALILALIYIVSGVLGMGPPSIKALKLTELPVYVATRTLDAYIWSVIPAAVTGAVLAGVVYTRGQFPWLLGVAVAAMVASAWAFATGGQAMGHVQFITVIAGVTAILGRLALVAAKVAD